MAAAQAMINDDFDLFKVSFSSYNHEFVDLTKQFVSFQIRKNIIKFIKMRKKKRKQD